MAQLQWLGDIEKETPGGYLAKALGGGIGKGFEAYAGAKEKEKDRELTRQHQEIQEEKLQNQIDRLDSQQKMNLVNMINKTIKMVGDDKAAEMLDDPQVQAAYTAAGIPLPRLPEKESAWEGSSWLDRVHAAITPRATEQEETRGELRPGGIFSLPKKKRVDVSVGTKTGGAGEKSPYPDYPDAFLEEGVWKVMRNGKKYRVEE